MKVLAVLGIVALVVYLIWKSRTSSGSFDSSISGLVGDFGGSPTPVSNSSSNSSSGQGLLGAWADAIWHHEGGNVGDRNWFNNNPGNLKFAGQAGAIGPDEAGFAVFPDMGTGWAALDRQLNRYVAQYPGYSLTQIMTRYLGGNPLDPQVTNQGDPFAYANDVARKLGVSASATLANIFGGV